MCYLKKGRGILWEFWSEKLTLNQSQKSILFFFSFPNFYTENFKRNNITFTKKLLSRDPPRWSQVVFKFSQKKSPPKPQNDIHDPVFLLLLLILSTNRLRSCETNIYQIFTKALIGMTRVHHSIRKYTPFNDKGFINHVRTKCTSNLIYTR